MDSTNKIVDNNLLKNERVIWSGKPDIKTIFDKNDKSYIPLSIIWNAAVIYRIYLGAELGVAVITLIIGFYFLVGRFIYKVYNKKATYYVVTDHRVMIINKLWNTIIDKQIKELSHIEREIRQNGIGTIRFGHTPLVHLWNENTGLEFMVGHSKIYGTPAPTFFDIENANKVYQLVIDLKS